MSVRRSSAVALAAVAFVSGCVKEVTQEASPTEIVIAAFNAPVKPGAVHPLANPNVVPTPNDLALQAAPTLTDPLLAAQKALLQAFVVAGGFPSDQAVGITIPIKRLTFDGTKYVVQAPPLVDPATLTTTGTSRTVVVLKIDVSPPAVQDVEVDAVNCTTGQIALMKMKNPVTGSRAWAPGRYAFAIRAGAVKTRTGVGVSADQGIALVAPNKDLSNPNNQPPGGLPASLVPQLEAVRASLWKPTDWNDVGGFWQPTFGVTTSTAAFTAISKYIAPEDVAAIATFEVAGNTSPLVPPTPVAPVDSASGIAPLPIDLLRTANHGTTIANNPAFGPAAAGLATLDGFSTTATVFAPVTVPIDASTVWGGTVYLFKLAGDKSVDHQLKEFRYALATGGPGSAATAEYVAQPDPLNVASGITITPPIVCQKTASAPFASGCSAVIGLQAGVPAPATGAPPLAALPPLEEDTDYAVVVTSAVKDVFGRPLQKSTVAKILLDPGFDPVATSSVDGKSLLAGIDDATATALRKMREDLRNVIAALPSGQTANDVALAYTFHTQSITETSLQLAAAPYGTEQAASFTALFVPAQVATTAFPGTYTNVAQFYDLKIPSIDATDKTTGALNPNQGAWTQTLLDAVVAVPSAANPNLPSCPPPAAALKCAPLVVFGHGLGGRKENFIGQDPLGNPGALVESLAARGFVVVAIDFPQHGSRAWCYQNTDCDNGGSPGVCTPFPGGLGQGDTDASGNPISPGTCTVGVPKASISGQTFISGNFFRTRDTFRQNLIDQAAAVLALARPPSTLWPAQPASDPFKTELIGRGLLVDPGHVYWEGISLGGIAGTEVLATSSRFSHGVTSVAGGTLVDVFTHAPAFQTNVNQLFTKLLAKELGGAPFSPTYIDGTNPAFNLTVATAYLKNLSVAKWILDPGEPLNFAKHLRTSPLPDLLSPTPALQPAKDVLGQVAEGDIVIPNPFNFELFMNGAISIVEYTSTTYPAANMHGVLAFDPTVQSQAAGYLFDLTTPPAPPTKVTIP